MYKALPEAEQLGELIDRSVRPLVVMGVGILASGKSTLLEQAAWLGGPNSPVVSVDSIVNRFTRMRAGRALPSFVDNEVHHQVEDNLKACGLALVDGTNLEKSKRIADINWYKEKAGAVAVGAVFLDTPVATVLERSKQRASAVIPSYIKQMDLSLRGQLPSREEGFDWVAVIHEDHSVEIQESA